MVTRLVCYLSPIVLGIIIPFLLNQFHKDKQTRYRKIIPSVFTLLLILIIILGVSIFTGGLNFIGFIKIAVFLFAYSLMIMALYIMLTSIGLSGILSQVIVIMPVLLMNGTVFYANPLIESVTSNQFREMIVQWSINLNPMLIIGANFFNYDMILAPQMYKLSLIQYYPHYYSSWGYVVSGYLFITAICFGITMLKKTSIKSPQ